MANTRQSTKRARQTNKRTLNNKNARGKTRAAVRAAVEAIQKRDVTQVKEVYLQAIRALSKAASKGSIPKNRASRKISRLTHLIKKTLPDALGTSGKSGS